MSSFKSLIKSIIKRINRLFYPRFQCPEDLIMATFNNIFIQKIIGINRKVNWPIHFTSKVIAPSKIEIGNRAPAFSMGCYLDGRNGIKFGKNVWIGPRVSIISKNHSVTNFKDYIEQKPIEIGDNCWLGTNSVILPEVKLLNHTIVAAGSVVTKSFNEENIIIGGVPAKKIKAIKEYDKK